MLARLCLRLHPQKHIREEVAAAGTSLSVNTPVRTSVPACISEGDTPSSASFRLL